MKCCSQKKLPKTSISQVLDSLKICTDIHQTINHPRWVSKTIRPGPCITKQCGQRNSLPSVAYSLIRFITDTHHTESLPEQNRCCRSTTSGSCITKQCGERSSLLINHISTNMFHYRHSPHWIFSGPESVTKGHNTWLMHYKAMR
jgi:hypothetical protein